MVLRWSGHYGVRSTPITAGTGSPLYDTLLTRPLSLDCPGNRQIGIHRLTVVAMRSKHRRSSVASAVDLSRSRDAASARYMSVARAAEPAFGGGGHRPVSEPGFEAWRRTSTERPGHQRARIRTIGETCNQPRKSTVNQFLWPVGRSVAYCKVDEMDLDFPPAMKRESRLRDARRLGQTGQVGSRSRRAVIRRWHQAAVTN